MWPRVGTWEWQEISTGVRPWGGGEAGRLFKGLSQQHPGGGRGSAASQVDAP